MSKPKRYTNEYKIKILDTYNNGDLSANALAQKIGIHPHTLRKWIKDYNDGKIIKDNYQKIESSKITVQSDNTFVELSELLYKINIIETEINEIKKNIKYYLINNY